MQKKFVIVSFLLGCINYIKYEKFNVKDDILWFENNEIIYGNNEFITVLQKYFNTYNLKSYPFKASVIYEIFCFIIANISCINYSILLILKRKIYEFEIEQDRYGLGLVFARTFNSFF